MYQKIGTYSIWEGEKMKLVKKYEEPTWLIRVDKQGKLDFELLCDGEVEIYQKGEDECVIVAKGKTVYREPKKPDRVLRFEVRK